MNMETRRAHLAPWVKSHAARNGSAFMKTRAYASKVKRGVRTNQGRVNPNLRDPQASPSIDADRKPEAKNKINQKPPLKDAMRKLVRKVHPDLFASGPPGASAVNDESLKTIQGVLDAVTKSKQIPDAGIKRLKFFVKDVEKPEGVRVVPFTFKTTGGDCRNLVARQLEVLFEQVGVQSEFSWNPGDWQHDPDNADNAQARGDVAKGWDLYPAARGHTDNGNNNHENNMNTDATEPTYDGTDTNESTGTDSTDLRKMSRKRKAELHGALKVNDKLFEAIAAVPWIPEPAGDDRVFTINEEIIPRLSKEGWRVSKQVIERIWRGERDDACVMDGVDAASGLALQAIVKHAKNFDRAYGTPNMPRKNWYPEPGKDEE
tara:strand:+ start:19930 stop:21054 length:1125 start_codon:yes stop_codon:yes gene_type:complete